MLLSFLRRWRSDACHPPRRSCFSSCFFLFLGVLIWMLLIFISWFIPHLLLFVSFVVLIVIQLVLRKLILDVWSYRLTTLARLDAVTK